MIDIPFLCPSCHKKTLLPGPFVSIAPNDFENIRIMLLTCESCSFLGLGLFEVDWHGNLEMPTNRDYGYPLTLEEFVALREKIQGCERAEWITCTCPVHEFFKQFYATRGWKTREQFDLTQDS